jgi:undecaprenyl-diphosphatase
VPRLLLSAAERQLAALLSAACAAVAAFLGVRFAHHSRAGWLDTAVDDRIRASLGDHPALLNPLVDLGSAIPVTVLTTALVLLCLATRRWRGAVLAAVAVPAAAALTERVLKPLVDRTLQGGLSYPSGHSTGVFALAAVIAVLLAGPLQPRLPAAVRLLLGLTAYLAAAAVAVALVGMGLHYFTDTVGGAAVSTAVVLLTALVIDWLGAARIAHPARAERLPGQGCFESDLGHAGQRPADRAADLGGGGVLLEGGLVESRHPADGH